MRNIGWGWMPGVGCLLFSDVWSWCLNDVKPIRVRTRVFWRGTRLAGWQAWLAGRLSVIQWCIWSQMSWSSDYSSKVHMCRVIDPPLDSWSYVTPWVASWPTPDVDPSIHQALVRSSPVSYSIPVTNYGGAQGTRTLLLQIMSLACSQYTMRPVRRLGDRWARSIKMMVVLMLPRRRDLSGCKEASHV